MLKQVELRLTERRRSYILIKWKTMRIGGLCMAILDRVKFDGLASRDWIVYKYPSEGLRLGSQLIVGEGQAAVFMTGGQICDIFGPGTYTLSTGNLPILSGLVNMPFGGKTPFTAEILFVNTVTQLELLWGTSDPIPLIDPKYHVRLRVRAFGQMGLKILDTRKFITELIGAMRPSDVVRYDKVVNFYKGVLVSKVKSIIAEIIINENISVLEISAHLDDISERVDDVLEPEFAEFGFKGVNFYIKSINFPEEDFDEVNKILQDKAAFEIMGDARYSVKRSFDVYEEAARNESGVAGAYMSAGVGLGAGVAVGSSMSQTVAVPEKNSVFCPKCNAANAVGAKFCQGCGASLDAPEKTCPKCGGKVATDARFCPSCGMKIGPGNCLACGAEMPMEARFCPSCGAERKAENNG